MNNCLKIVIIEEAIEILSGIYKREGIDCETQYQVYHENTRLDI